MTKHTPGTWLVDELTVYALNNTDTNRFSAWVQRGWLNDEAGRTPQAELVANAQLIAAAPDLLELAKLVAQDYEDAADWKDARGKLASMARAALDKAGVVEDDDGYDPYWGAA